MHTRMTGLALVVLGALVGCGNAQHQNDLDAADAKWQAAAPAAYEWVVQRSCFCPDIEPLRVQVRGGEVTSAVRLMAATTEVTLASGDYQTWFVVPGLFAVVQKAIDEGADKLTVSYDATLGYPTTVQIDWHANATDDEEYFTARDLAALP